MANAITKTFSKFAGGDPFPGRLDCSMWINGEIPPFPRGQVDIIPRARRSVTDVVDFAGLLQLERCKADCRQVFDVDQIDIFLRGDNPTTSDPIERVPSRSVDSCHPKYGCAALFHEEFFPLNARSALTDRRGFVDPWRRTIGLIADGVGRRAAKYDQSASGGIDGFCKLSDRFERHSGKAPEQIG